MPNLITQNENNMADDKRVDYQRALRERCQAFLASHRDSVAVDNLFEFVRDEALTSFKNGKSANAAQAKKRDRRS